jgi:hypothetical protein
MARDLGVYASTIHGAVAPAMAAATHETPKLFIASLRGLETMGLPFEAAAALLALGCALFAFLAIWLAFRAIGNILSSLAKGAAGVAGAAKSRLVKIELPEPPAAEFRPRAPEAQAPHASAPDEPFVPVWDPYVAGEPVVAASPIPVAGVPAAAAAAGLPPPIPIRRAPSRPTPASVAAAAGISQSLTDLADPLAHEDVPPGFLFIDTSPAEPSAEELQKARERRAAVAS